MGRIAISRHTLFSQQWKQENPASRNYPDTPVQAIHGKSDEAVFPSTVQRFCCLFLPVPLNPDDVEWRKINTDFWHQKPHPLPVQLKMDPSG